MTTEDFLLKIEDRLEAREIKASEIATALIKAGLLPRSSFDNAVEIISVKLK